MLLLKIVLTYLVILTFLIEESTSMCVANQQGCQTCTNISSCYICKSGYKLNNITQRCEQCLVANCADCFINIYTCVACYINYYYRDNLCVSCTDNDCIQCPVNNDTCTGCIKGKGMNPTIRSCRPCMASNCSVCTHDVNVCIQCNASSNMVAQNGSCVPCSLPYPCIQCGISGSICNRCTDGMGPNSVKSDCEYCSDLKCQLCEYSSSDCLRCQIGFGLVWVNPLGGSCQPCADPNCLQCPLNNNLCISCTNSTGVSADGTCQGCDPSCIQCQTNYTLCNECNVGYGLSSTNSCLVCSQSSCTQCFNDYLSCQACGSGTGLDIGTGSCVSCSGFCQLCSPYNSTQCTSCLPNLYLDSNYACLPCDPVCINCTGSSTNCTSCSSGYYQFPNLTCSQCPTYCTQCQYNINYSLPECIQCQSNYSLLDRAPIICAEFCGDSVTTFYDCDNQVGVPFDGCDDMCYVQPDFNCSINQTNICSYRGVLEMKITFFQRTKFQNKFSMKVQIYPPLYVFKHLSQEELKKIFTFSDANFSMESISYDPITHQLTIQADFSVDFLNNNIQIVFQPEMSSNQMFFASKNQKIKLSLVQQTQKIGYYSSFSLLTMKIVFYLSYCIAVMGWIVCFVGLFMRKLDGIQAMFVIQFSWLCSLWIGCPLYYQLQQLIPLKFTSGYNHQFIIKQKITSKQAPYISQFKLSTQFVNNYNLSIVLQIIGIIAVLITYTRLKIHKKPDNKYRIQQTKQNIQNDKKEQNTNIFQKLYYNYQIAQQCLLYATLFNLIYLTQCVMLLIMGGQIANTMNIIIMSISIIISLIIYIRFIIYPDPCGYFRYSFDRSKNLALQHYIFVPIMLILCVTMLSIKSLPFLSMAPVLLAFLYNLIRKPYINHIDNYRSCFNMFVMCIFVGFRVALQNLSSNNQQLSMHNSLTLNLWLLLNIFLLLLVIVVALVCMVWDYYLINYKIPRQLQQKKKTIQYAQQFYRIQILKQLSITKMNKQLIQQKQPIIQTVVPKTNRIIDYSNKLLVTQPLQNHDNKLITTFTQQQQQYQYNLKNNRKIQLNTFKRMIKQQHTKQKSNNNCNCNCNFSCNCNYNNCNCNYNNNGNGNQCKNSPKLLNHQLQINESNYRMQQHKNKQQQQLIQKQNSKQKQVQQIKQKVCINILKDQNKYVQYKAAIQYIAQNTDFNPTNQDPTQIQMYEKAYQDI